MSVVIHVECKCGTAHRHVPRAFWGHRARCHVCGRSVRIPRPEAEEALDDLFERFADESSSSDEHRPAPGGDPMSRYQLGRLAVRTRLATRDEIEEALLVQARARETGGMRRLGAILVDQGILDESDLLRLLALQRHKVAALANRLAGKGRLDREQIQEIEIELARAIEMPRLPAPNPSPRRPASSRDEPLMFVRRDQRRVVSRTSRRSRGLFYAVTGLFLLGAALVLGAFLAVRAERSPDGRSSPAAEQPGSGAAARG